MKATSKEKELELHNIIGAHEWEDWSTFEINKLFGEQGLSRQALYARRICKICLKLEARVPVGKDWGYVPSVSPEIDELIRYEKRKQRKRN